MVGFTSLVGNLQRVARTITNNAEDGRKEITQPNASESEGVDKTSGIEDLIVLLNYLLLAEFASVLMPSATLINAQEHVLTYVQLDPRREQQFLSLWLWLKTTMRAWTAGGKLRRRVSAYTSGRIFPRPSTMAHLIL